MIDTYITRDILILFVLIEGVPNYVCVNPAYYSLHEMASCFYLYDSGFLLWSFRIAEVWMLKRRMEHDEVFSMQCFC